MKDRKRGKVLHTYDYLHFTKNSCAIAEISLFYK